MRQKQQIQPCLCGPWADHPLAEEMAVMAAILDAHPVIAELAWQDLTDGRRADIGAPGMEAMAVVKAAMVQKLMRLSYERLSFHLADSVSCRRFVGLGLAQSAPSASALQDNIKRIKPGTWERINRLLVKWAADKGIEKGRKVRIDSTPVEANIHHPTDDSLLADLIRVICRTLKKAGLPKNFSFRDRGKVAKRLSFRISQAGGPRDRRRLYNRLLSESRDIYQEALAIATRLDQARLDLRNKLMYWLDILQRVIEQTWQRVILGKRLPAAQKIVSVFETHADILAKDNRQTIFGHKVCLTGGPSRMITDCIIEAGNPPDSLLAPKMIVRHEGIFGHLPKQAAYDGGFASLSNLGAIKGYGVSDVAFHKKRGLKVSEMVKSSWVFKMLKDFRAGIEGRISTLKRAFGLTRCTWRGEQGFHAYVWTSVLAYNLVVLARHCLNDCRLG